HCMAALLHAGSRPGGLMVWVLCDIYHACGSKASLSTLLKDVRKTPRYRVVDTLRELGAARSCCLVRAPFVGAGWECLCCVEWSPLVRKGMVWSGGRTAIPIHFRPLRLGAIGTAQ